MLLLTYNNHKYSIKMNIYLFNWFTLIFNVKKIFPFRKSKRKKNKHLLLQFSKSFISVKTQTFFKNRSYLKFEKKIEI